jgi:hypothetical protein
MPPGCFWSGPTHGTGIEDRHGHDGTAAMRSPVTPLLKFSLQLSAWRDDASKSGFLGDWQRWTRAERIGVVVIAAVISLVALLPFLV